MRFCLKELGAENLRNIARNYVLTLPDSIGLKQTNHMWSRCFGIALYETMAQIVGNR